MCRWTVLGSRFTRAARRSIVKSDSMRKASICSATDRGTTGGWIPLAAVVAILPSAFINPNSPRFASIGFRRIDFTLCSFNPSQRSRHKYERSRTMVFRNSGSESGVSSRLQKLLNASTSHPSSVGYVWSYRCPTQRINSYCNILQASSSMPIFISSSASVASRGNRSSGIAIATVCKPAQRSVTMKLSRLTDQPRRKPGFSYKD